MAASSSEERSITSKLDPDAVGAQLAAVATVVQLHDLHIWEITSGQPALSAHILVAPGADCHRARQAAEQLLLREHHIDHTTLQVDHATVDDADPDASDAEHCGQSHGPTHRSTVTTGMSDTARD